MPTPLSSAWTQVQPPLLIEPPELLHPRPLPQPLRRHILHPQSKPLPSIPPLIVQHHPPPQQQCERQARGAERGGRPERGDVLGGVAVQEDVGGDDAHEVGEGDADGGEDEAAAFVRDVVVVPDVEENGGGGCAPIGGDKGGSV